MLIVATQVYLPPRDVWSGEKVRVIMYSPPELLLPNDISLTLSTSTTPDESIHTMSGSVFRFLTVDTVQTSEYISLAVEIPSVVIATPGAGRSKGRKEPLKQVGYLSNENM